VTINLKKCCIYELLFHVFDTEGSGLREFEGLISFLDEPEFALPRFALFDEV
jgi:hypothetical protein